MPQQINLCSPILLTQKRYLSANTMVIALGVFLLLGGVLSGVWVWNVNRANDAFAQSVATQARELESLKAAIQSNRANAAPAPPALLALLQERRNTIAQRKKLQEALKEGMFRSGWGHSDRLTWVARSIPDPVWLTEVRMDGTRFEVTGFTLEPAALNAWVDKLSLSPLMQNLKLATVRVEHATPAQRVQPATASSAPAEPLAAVRPVWSFNLVSIEPPAMGASLPGTPGSKP